LTLTAVLGYDTKKTLRRLFMSQYGSVAVSKEDVMVKLAFWKQYGALENAGKHEEALAFYKKNMPLPAWGAKVMKKLLGAEYIRTSGYDLSEVEAKLGKSWLDN
jgi:hypothetical protein